MLNTPLTLEQVLEKSKLASASYGNNKVGDIVADRWQVIYTSSIVEAKNNKGEM